MIRLAQYILNFVLQELTEDWGYDMTLFIADFGGSLGFLLGISLLSVLEILEGLSLSCYRLYTNWKQNRRSKIDPPVQKNFIQMGFPTPFDAGVGLALTSYNSSFLLVFKTITFSPDCYDVRMVQ